ncbi:MAG: nitrous oxide reductase family maturation protein NosD [Cyclobacterium sp.]|nr:nitrous oxide reductase family maturation protein NosD [Cyclobacterium sp.]
MKTFFCHLIVLILFYSTGLKADAYHVKKGTPLNSIKKAVEKANEMDTLFIHGGTYLENQILISKALSLIGVNRPVIDSQGGDEIFIVQADKVLIQGLRLQNIGVSHLKDRAAIRIVEAREVIIDDNILINAFFGIYLQNSSQCIVQNNTIKGNAHDEMNAGNAIHIWKGSQMEVINNHLSHHRDGIYFEFVDQSLIRGNTSQDNMRYGLHFMFSNYDTYEENSFQRNGAGVAVMFSKHIKMVKNTFEENWGGSSYGILLKEISDGFMSQNTFKSNTVGVYAEGASRIKIENNNFIDNGKAMDIKGNCIDNQILSNNFIGNTFEVLTNSRSNLNHFEGNYWAQYKGHDLDKDGIGDFAHRPVNLFALITDKIPAANMLLHSFLVDALDMAERMFPEIIPEHLSDEQPRIKPISYD